jgi:hypothetical protein
MNFEENTRISAFVKDSDKIWEGIIITRSNNTKVVLNESTGRWKKLSDLDNIKLLNEDFTTMSSSSDATSNINTTENKKLKYDDIKKSFVSDIVGDDPAKAVQNAENILTNKSAISAGGQALFDKSQTAEDKDAVPKNQNDAIEHFNTEVKNIAGQAEAAKTGDVEDGIEEVRTLAGIKETYKQLHPSLQRYLEDSKEWIDENGEGFEFESDDDGWEVHKDGKYLGWVKNKKDAKKEFGKEKTDKSMDYENDDYLDVPDDVKADIMADIQDLLTNKEIDIEDRIKQSYELSDSDAEEFVIQGMEHFIKTSDVKPKDSIKDIKDEEIEKSFEDSIDKFDGKEEDMLDYLADTYEINPDEAEKIVEKTGGNLTETIYEFVKLVKKHLSEGIK